MAPGGESGAGGSAWSGCPSRLALPQVADGVYTFRARARDAAGNTDPSPPRVTFLVSSWFIAQQVDSGAPSWQRSQQTQAVVQSLDGDVGSGASTGTGNGTGMGSSTAYLSPEFTTILTAPDYSCSLIAPANNLTERPSVSLLTSGAQPQSLPAPAAPSIGATTLYLYEGVAYNDTPGATASEGSSGRSQSTGGPGYGRYALVSQVVTVSFEAASGAPDATSQAEQRPFLLMLSYNVTGAVLDAVR